MIFRPHSKENSITVSERELSCPPSKHLLLSFSVPSETSDIVLFAEPR